MNETSKFKVKSCKPRTMVFQALIFDTESWIPWALCSLSSTFELRKEVEETIWDEIEIKEKVEDSTTFGIKKK
jgi:hypothetical protein